MHTMTTCAIYVRISRDAEGSGLGVERQEADCRALAERLGWSVAEVFSDNDTSAYSGKTRPGYKAMLQAVETGLVTAVVAWHTDRLHRRAAELEEFVALAERHHLQVQTVTAGTVDLSTASGRMVARMLGAAAQHEIDHARERMARAKAQAASQGLYRGGPRPYGYEPDGVTIREDEAEKLREAARQVLAGRSLTSLAKEMGFVGTRGGAMAAQDVRRLLLRPRNAGLLEVDGRITGTACWPPLLDEGTWREVVAVLTDPSRRTTPGPERRHLLSGIAVCGVCKEPLRSHRASRRRLSYSCPSRHVARSVEHVEEYVREVVCGFLGRPDARDVLTPRPESNGPLRERARVLRARLAEFEADYAEGLIGARVLREVTAKVEAELNDVEARLAAAAPLPGSAVLAAPDPAATFLAAPLDVQRALVSRLFTVTVNVGRRGRPKGWRPGEPYADMTSVEVLRR